MPWAILKFKLPEEKEEFKDAQQAGLFNCLLAELDRELRADIKYSDGKLQSQHWRDRLRQLCVDYEINLD